MGEEDLEEGGIVSGWNVCVCVCMNNHVYKHYVE